MSNLSGNKLLLLNIASSSIHTLQICLKIRHMSVVYEIGGYTFRNGYKILKVFQMFKIFRKTNIHLKKWGIFNGRLTLFVFGRYIINAIALWHRLHWGFKHIPLSAAQLDATSDPFCLRSTMCAISNPLHFSILSGYFCNINSLMAGN